MTMFTTIQPVLCIAGAQADDGQGIRPGCSVLVTDPVPLGREGLGWSHAKRNLTFSTNGKSCSVILDALRL